MSASIRLGSQHIPINDAHIRFERSTESKAKDAATVERVSDEHAAAVVDEATCCDANGDGMVDDRYSVDYHYHLSPFHMLMHMMHV